MAAEVDRIETYRDVIINPIPKKRAYTHQDEHYAQANGVTDVYLPSQTVQRQQAQANWTNSNPRGSNAQQSALGRRYTKGKVGIYLLPVRALEEVAKVLDYGKEKYSDSTYDATDNWRKGLSWRSTVGSLLRHSFSFLRGEDRDPESGLYHMAHVAANALFLLQFLVTNGGTDDRYKEDINTEAQANQNYGY